MAGNVTDALERLKRLEDQVDASELSSEDAVPTVRESLAHVSPRVVARAAKFCKDHWLDVLVEPLLASYQRMLKTPVKTDPGCEAKFAIVEALRRIDYADIDFYLDALKYRQYEPVWGGETDTAAELRAEAILAASRLGVPDLGLLIVDLMVDEEPATRAGAIRALAGSGRIEAEPLLRLKLYTGDERAEVMGECFSGLMAINADKSFELVAERLQSEDRGLRNEAALAIVESRHPDGLTRLQVAFRSQDDPEDQRAMALAIGLMRQSDAIDYLLSWIKVEDAERAAAVIVALGHCQDIDGVSERTRAAVNECDHRYIARTFNEEFG